MRRVVRSINLETGPWIDLQVAPSELRPCHTLVTGQVFGWQKIENYNIWVGVLERHPLAIKQTPSSVLYASLLEQPDVTSDQLHQTLRSYFQLDICLSDLYQMVRYNSLSSLISFSFKVPYTVE
jgi:hypothetical protein